MKAEPGIAVVAVGGNSLIVDRKKGTIAPIINTGIAHRQAGIGQIGAGITRAPLACFAQAIVDLAGRIER